MAVRKRYWCLILVVVLGTSCEDLTDKKLLSQKSNLIVVDGIITSEEINHLIHLSHPYEAQNETGDPVAGAVLTLESDNMIYTLIESPAGSGDYYTPVMKAVTSKTYTLTIVVGNQTYSASDTPPAVEPLDTFQDYAIDSLYALLLNQSGSSPNYIQYELDWSSTSNCATGNCKGDVYFYDLKSTDVNDIFKPDTKDFYFPAGTTIIRTKYSASPAYKAFLRSMLSETSWHGGIFDVQPAPVNTNFNGGAIGFFAVSTVVSDTVVVK